jgi:hypothetical protein
MSQYSIRPTIPNLKKILKELTLLDRKVRRTYKTHHKVFSKDQKEITKNAFSIAELCCREIACNLKERR